MINSLPHIFWWFTTYPDGVTMKDFCRCRTISCSLPSWCAIDVSGTRCDGRDDRDGWFGLALGLGVRSWKLGLFCSSSFFFFFFSCFFFSLFFLLQNAMRSRMVDVHVPYNQWCPDVFKRCQLASNISSIWGVEIEATLDLWWLLWVVATLQ